AIRIVAWSSERRDSATLRITAWPPHAGENATQRRFVGRLVSQVRAPVQSSVTPVVAAIALPVAAGRVMEAVAASTPVLPDSSAPSVAEDTVRVAHARTGPEGLASERLVSLVRGPGIQIFAPTDGAVLSTDRVYVGVKAESSVPVVLYDGATAIDSVRTRIDGVFDFIAVPLARGPHRLRVAVKNSWGQERWDSIAVHVTGLPAHLEIPRGPLALIADGRTTTVLHVRVTDAWGVPVALPAYVTVSAKGAEPRGVDADASSVGFQLLSSASGQLTVELRPGRVVGPGELELKSGDATASLALELLPEVRGLTVAGSGLIGAG